MTVTVEDPAAFISNPNTTLALQNSIAALMGGDPKNVEIFFEVVEGVRRLDAFLRRLASSVIVTYRITFPIGTNVTAKAETINMMNTTAVATTINTELTKQLGAAAPVITVTSASAAVYVATSTTTTTNTDVICDDIAPPIESNPTCAGQKAMGYCAMLKQIHPTACHRTCGHPICDKEATSTTMKPVSAVSTTARDVTDLLEETSTASGLVGNFAISFVVMCFSRWLQQA